MGQRHGHLSDFPIMAGLSQRGDAIQRIIEKMRMNLRLQHLDLRLRHGQLLAQVPIDQMIDLPQQCPKPQRQRTHFVLLGQQTVVEFGQKIVVLRFPNNSGQPVKPLEDAIGKPCAGKNNSD